MNRYCAALIASAISLFAGFHAAAWEDPKGDPFFGFWNAVVIDGMVLDGKFNSGTLDPLVSARLSAGSIPEMEKKFIVFASDPHTESAKRAVMAPLLKAVQDPTFQAKKRALGSDFEHANRDWLKRYHDLYASLPIPTSDTMRQYRLIGYPNSQFIILD